MLPGMGQVRDQLESIDEREIDRIEAIIYSMTPAERADVSILNGSRRSRIAKGAGVTVTEVNGLVNRFTDARKMMKQMGGMMGGAPGGMPRGLGKPKQQPAKKPKKGQRVSGNPAKRAGVVADEPTPTTAPGAAFGLGPDLPQTPEELAAALGDFQLPPDIQRMLGGGR
jgi:signal recognition particle subunit SRP54